METLRKHNIDLAFSQSMKILCYHFKIAPCQMTLEVRFFKDNKIKLFICKRDKIKYEIDVLALISSKIIGLRLDSESILKLLFSLHFAFMKENKLTAIERLSLIIYESTLVGCTCVGIMVDDKATKALKISDVFEALGLGNEQLN